MWQNTCRGSLISIIKNNLSDSPSYFCADGSSTCIFKPFTGFPRLASASFRLSASFTFEFAVPNCELAFGEGLKAVGSDEALGSWDAAKGVELQWGEGNNWSGSAELPGGAQVQFKLVKTAGEGEPSWEEGANREVTLPEEGAKIVCQWGNPEATSVEGKAPAAKGRSTASKRKAPAKPRSRAKAAAAPEAAADTKAEEEVAPPAEAAPAAEQAQHVEPEPAPVVPEPQHEAPAPVEPTQGHATDGSLHPELAKLASAVTHSPDGTLSITFGEEADSVDAATLAAKLQ